MIIDRTLQEMVGGGFLSHSLKDLYRDWLSQSLFAPLIVLWIENLDSMYVIIVLTC